MNLKTNRTAGSLSAFRKLTALVTAIAAVLALSAPAFASGSTVSAEYKGSGIVIAVIDNGFDIDNEYFSQLSPDAQRRLTVREIALAMPELNGISYGARYVNPKVPYACDYTDGDENLIGFDSHGTHIAGIIGADGENFKGVASDAQLLLMKVFGDNGNADEDAIVRAFEDAVTLGADVINISVGIAVGYADGKPFGSELGAALEEARKAGITVTCAAGNSGRSGLGSDYSLRWGLSAPSVLLADNGTVASPASYGSVTAVGSLDIEELEAVCFTLLDGDAAGAKSSYDGTGSAADLQNGSADGKTDSTADGNGGADSKTGSASADGTGGANGKTGSASADGTGGANGKTGGTSADGTGSANGKTGGTSADGTGGANGKTGGTSADGTGGANGKTGSASADVAGSSDGKIGDSANGEAEESEEYSGTKIRYTDSTHTYVEPFGESFSDRFDGSILEYVRVPGLGKAEDYAGLESLEGRLALIERGEISFVEKLNNAAEHGAVGAIVFDNTDTIEYSLMQLEGAVIPGVFVSRHDGLMMDAAAYKKIGVKRDDSATFKAENAGQPASYTSWGVTPSLTLKPELSAVGSDVRSVMNGGIIGSLSGSSQASAYTAGVAALWYGYLYGMGLKKGVDFDADYVKALMMNAAYVNVSNTAGVENSPRVQGAGEVNAEDVGNVELLITADGRNAKIELGDRLGESFGFDIKVKNITDKTVNAVLAAVFLGEDYTVYKVDENGMAAETDDISERDERIPILAAGEMIPFDSEMKVDNVNINRYASDYGEYEITLKAGEEQSFRIEVNIGSELFDEYSAIYTNGFFVEGFVYAATSSTVSSIPYVGFSHDWGALPVFDGELYGDSGAVYKNTHVYTDVALFERPEVEITLGQNAFENNGGFDAARVAFSPNGDKCADSVSLCLDTLRSAVNVGYRIISPEGEVVFESGDREFMRKNYVTDELKLSYTDTVLWGGRDVKNSSYVFPDGVYRVVFYATPAYEGAEEQTFEFDLILDTKMPRLVSYEFVTEGEKTLLKLKVRDDNYLMGTAVYGMIYGDVSNVLNKDAVLEGTKPGEIHEVVFDITGFTDEYIYIDIVDYAFNYTVERIVNVNYTQKQQ